MGIGRMYSLVGARRLEQTRPKAEVASADGGKKASEFSLEKVTAFVPTEAISLYVSGTGIFSPQGYNAKWTVFFVSLAFIPVIILLNYF
jgi:hypothetical protein